ncbi:hypothetical protein LTR53_009480 [Teratosphaeriaceae sp. CCFEE 6253]|nr:hypothetical protein LTR53_009480 [Teratosphaeriaceae sp. CCFEE 6253]
MSEVTGDGRTADGEKRYQGLESVAMDETPKPQSSTGWKGLLKSQGKVLAAFLVTLGILIYEIAQPAYPEDLLRGSLTNVTLAPPAGFHVLIPSSEPDADLCKLLLSASILGYPSPVVLDATRFTDRDDHLPKAKGVFEYLHSLDTMHDDDLVLVLDGHDSWLQLRPQTLLDRYFGILRRADKRIGSELGPVAKTNGIRQDIVFGAQKACAGWGADDPPCYAVPQSTLPKNIYGSQTDVEGDEAEPSHTNIRQRYLNVGVAMGSVHSLRKLYGEALLLRREQPEIGDEQAVLSSMFGAQEVWREVARQDSGNGSRLSSWRQKGSGSKITFNPEHLADVRAKAASREDKQLEYGIGLDYGSEIVLNTGDAEADAAWLALGNATQLKAAELALRPRVSRSRLRKLATDIAGSLPPFWTFTTEADLPRWTAWQDLALLTNVFTGTTPVAIHHDPHPPDSAPATRQQRLETWWPRLWFSPHTRVLLDAYIYAPIVPVAVGGVDAQTQRQYWPHELYKGGARNGAKKNGEGGEWVTFEAMCGGDSEELFRDGLGPWVLPDYH